MKNKETSPAIKTEDQLRDSWESLGIAFAINQSGIKHADPELTLIQTIQEFKEHRKMLKLTLAWLKDYGELLHVERLKALAKELSSAELAWLGGLSSYRVEDGDSRWKTLAQWIENRLGSPKAIFPTSRLDDLQTQRVGEDVHFKKFGLLIPKADAADLKKLRPLSEGVRGNLWLRMRSLFGTNWRADMATVLVLGLAQNPYQAECILGCAKETAYRNWKALKEAEVETLLRGAA
jgi:hypothetical protein